MHIVPYIQTMVAISMVCQLIVLAKRYFTQAQKLHRNSEVLLNNESLLHMSLNLHFVHVYMSLGLKHIYMYFLHVFFFILLVGIQSVLIHLFLRILVGVFQITRKKIKQGFFKQNFCPIVEQFLLASLAMRCIIFIKKMYVVSQSCYTQRLQIVSPEIFYQQKAYLQQPNFDCKLLPRNFKKHWYIFSLFKG
eukprot:TRINITY_DN25887_c0_g1_i5.p5 TRINITY_DN25887_c0_g1~~TRINITY_DN25887_c0_g1_i5.p5  ORF type:complete len:192 (-),score=-10.19 TRINITY_DN25887_c0_g1_i5:669-1244(-)